MQFSSIQTESRFGVTVRHSLITQDTPPDKLLIMLPGYGYTCEHPVLYYLRRAAAQQGYDVLGVQYGFQVTHIDLQAENMAYVQDDVEQAVRPVLSRGYSRVCVAGKSMGTPLAAEVARSLTRESTSLLLLTPVGGAVQGLGNIPALAIIGTADALYSAEEVAAYKNHPTIQWKVFEGLNHSLEVQHDWGASLAVLPEIIRTCEEFIA
jgi:surfactin synthase thioesterase subunit